MVVGSIPDIYVAAFRIYVRRKSNRGQFLDKTTNKC